MIIPVGIGLSIDISIAGEDTLSIERISLPNDITIALCSKQ